LEADAPVLEQGTLASTERFYFVGLIGGKEVGKSALVNALVGREITLRTSHGPGTEIAIAYVHASNADGVRRMLERELPGQHRIVTHDVAALRRQVLLDLPDIDSHYAAHVEVTRRMLRHMLYPVWVQSVEKYADGRPRELLSLVAEGNAPQNFIFLLNKVDQVVAREGEDAARELADDYARRLGKMLKLPEPPRVWMVSAQQPERWDLPSLRQLLGQHKSEQDVEHSTRQAVRRQGTSLAEWVAGQGLEQRLAAVGRLRDAAEQEVNGRIALPLVDVALPRLLDDPAYRLALGDELMNERVKRWPIVNVFHLVLSPLIGVLRRRLPVAQQTGLAGADELVDLHLQNLGPGGQRLADAVQSTFAMLQQSSPQVSRMYAGRKLWETMAAEAAEGDLRRRLGATVRRQRETLRSRWGSGFFSAIVRFVLTVGAVLWFPIAQPILEALLSGTAVKDLTLLAVKLLGVTYLLKNVGFLAIYFVFLWMLVKWDTQRRVDKTLQQWRTGDALDPTLSLTGQVVEWTADLLEPINAAERQLTDLTRRAAELRESVASAA
jgi:GTPase Era involved in 16S rRNA processing